MTHLLVRARAHAAAHARTNKLARAHARTHTRLREAEMRVLAATESARKADAGRAAAAAAAEVRPLGMGEQGGDGAEERNSLNLMLAWNSFN
jgi:hypothetical protein